MASGDILFQSGFSPNAILWDGAFVSFESGLYGLDSSSSNLNYGNISAKLNGGGEPPYGMGWPDRLSKIQPGRQYKITITEV